MYERCGLHPLVRNGRAAAEDWQGRMDAAVDHFAPMGYNKADVRKLINALLKADMYGKKGWPLLEENCYQVVQEALFEKQEEEERLQLQQQQEQEEPQVVQEALLEEQEQEEMLQLQQEEEEEGQVMQLQQQEEEEEEPQMMQLVQQEEEEAQFLFADVRKLINALLKADMYGKKGWPLLEENCCQVVQEALFEKHEEEERLQLQQQEEERQVVQEAFFEEQEEGEILQQQEEEEGEVMQLQQHEGEEPQVMEHVQEEQQQLEEGDEDQQREAAMMGAPSENEMPFMLVHEEVPCESMLAEYHDDTHVQEQEQQQQQQEEEEEDQEQQQREEEDEVQQQEAASMAELSENDMPCEAVSAVEQTEEEVVPMIIDPPAPEAASPHPEATRTSHTRRPCFGWISESESDSDYEEFLASRNCKSQVQEEVFLKESGSVVGCEVKPPNRLVQGQSRSCGSPWA